MTFYILSICLYIFEARKVGKTKGKALFLVKFGFLKSLFHENGPIFSIFLFLFQIFDLGKIWAQYESIFKQRFCGHT